ncbi:MAG: ATP-binding protein [Chloroflexi bacterium]|nr:ATP-binding protein [Chloroflexota bacterium]
MTTLLYSNPLVRLLHADTLQDFENALAEVQQAHTTHWSPLGGIVNNRGAVEVSGDPGRALVERVTNGIDAVLEDGHNVHHGTPECRSPQEAAHAWFGVPLEGLSQVATRDRQRLAERVEIRLLEGSGASSRTVEVLDKGTGIPWEDVPSTILSLHESNKLQKRYLAGVYGQGGSSTFASSQYTLIATRPEATDSLAISVVKYDDLPPEEYKTGHYVYLRENSGVLRLDGQDVHNFPAGTLVRHIGYDLSGYNSPVGPTSVYGLLNRILFNPVLPVWLDSRIHRYRRVIKGSRNALNGAIDEGDENNRGPALDHWTPAFYIEMDGFGQIGVEYWLLERPTTNRTPVAAFVHPTRPVVLTVNGQNQAELPRSLIQRRAGLPYLVTRLIVHVSGDALTPEAKRLLFVSNREDARSGVVKSLIEDEVVRALAEDDDLQRLNQEARQQVLHEQDEATREEIRRQVVRLLGVHGNRAAAASRRRSSSRDDSSRGGSSSSRHRTVTPIEVHDPPTYVRIVWPSDREITFYDGQQRYIRIETDAPERYYSDNPEISRFNFIISSDWLAPRGNTQLREGRMRSLVRANGAVGSSCNFRVELSRPGLTTLSDERICRLVEAPPFREESGAIDTPAFNIIAVSGPDDPSWQTLDWPSDASTVASTTLQNPNGELDIYYSEVFPRFAQQRAELERRDPSLAARFKMRYEIWVAVHSILLHRDMSEVSGPEFTAEEAAAGNEPTEVEQRAERRRLAELAVLVASREATESVSP